MYFRSLQVFRGIAAVAVVLYHVKEYLQSLCDAPGTPFRVFDYKFGMGAWFFFSLSGFLMAYMIDSSRERFLSRRLARIYPTFWLAVCLTIIVKVALFGTVANPRLIEAASLLPFGGKPAYTLGVEWTLIYEVFFYCVCAFFANARLYRLFPAFLACWAAAIATANLGFGCVTVILPTPGQIVFSLFNLLFIMGGLGYHVYKRLRPTARARRVLLYVVGGGLLTYYLRDGRELMGFFGLGLIFTGAILWGALGDQRDKPVPGGSFFERLGDASYGLYLIHVPIMTCVFYLGTRKWNLNYPTTLGLIGTILALIGGWWFGKVDLALQRKWRQRLSRPRPGGGTDAGAPHIRLWRRWSGSQTTIETPAG